MSDISALRKTLFDVLDGLKEGTMTVDTAKTINETSQVIINTAKVEIDFLKIAKERPESGLFPALENANSKPVDKKQTTSTGVQSITQVPGGTVTTHRMRG